MSGETQKDESAWTTDSLKEKIEGDIANLEKFTRQQIKDMRDDYNRRFAAQEKAVETAFEAAKQAIIKSESGVEKRSDSVYVTITKLQDALASVMPRAEAEQRFHALAESVSDNTNRLNKSEGSSKGSQVTTSKLYAAIGAVVAILGIIIVIANSIFK